MLRYAPKQVHLLALALTNWKKNSLMSPVPGPELTSALLNTAFSSIAHGILLLVHLLYNSLQGLKWKGFGDYFVRQRDDFVKVLYMFPLTVRLLFLSFPSGSAVCHSCSWKRLNSGTLVQFISLCFSSYFHKTPTSIFPYRHCLSYSQHCRLFTHDRITSYDIGVTINMIIIEEEKKSEHN